MNVGHLITRAARMFPERTAVVCGAVRRTFAEVNARANRLAHGLYSLGVCPGDRVAVVMYNSADYVEVEFCLSKAGFVAVPLNAKLLVQDHLFMVNDCGASALLLGAEFAARFLAVRDQMPGVRHIIAQGPPQPGAVSYDALQASAPEREPDWADQINFDSLHNIMYTSGTTGRPKGAMHTHRVKWTVTMNLLTDMGPAVRDDRLLHVAPLTHGTGYFVLPWWSRGATNVIMREFDAREACETIQRERITVFKLVPTVIGRLLAFPDLDRYDLSSLHTIIYGASPMPVDKLREAIGRFGNIFIQLYGQTEALCCITYLPKEDHIIDGTPEEVRRLASAGRPFSNLAVRVVTEDGRDVPPGETGEVIVSGTHIMAGYWNRPEESADTLRDGWVYTRDLATVDERGYVYLLDRKGDMIVSGGMNIYPREVEEVLNQHPAVLEAAVFGVPDPDWGEAVMAVVALRPGATATEAELINFCREHMASFKKPKYVEFLPELSRNAYGKVNKKELKARYWQGRSRQIN